MDLLLIQEKLRELLKERIALGATQKQVAEALGMEQAHVSRFLNGRGNFHLATLNQLLRFLQLDVEDLVPVEEMIRRVPTLDYSNSDYCDVPLLKGKLGPGQPFPVEGRIASYRAFLRSFVRPFHRPVLAVVGAKEDAMVPAVQPRDLVLLDTSAAKRKEPLLDRIYAVAFDNGSGIRHCGRAGSSVVLVGENLRGAQGGPREISLDSVDILSVIRGEVVWIGRELKAEPRA